MVQVLEFHVFLLAFLIIFSVFPANRSFYVGWSVAFFICVYPFHQRHQCAIYDSPHQHVFYRLKDVLCGWHVQQYNVHELLILLYFPHHEDCQKSS